MFSTKQQKTPVSRTISAPERKGVKQMVRDNQTSIANRGVIQRLNMYYQPQSGFLLSSDKISFTGPSGDGLDLKGVPVTDYAIVFSFRAKITLAYYGYGYYYVLANDNYVTFLNDECLFFSLGTSPFIFSASSSYVAHVPHQQLQSFLNLERMGIIRISVLVKPYDIVPHLGTSAHGMDFSFSRVLISRKDKKMSREEIRKRNLWKLDTTYKVFEGKYINNHYNVEKHMKRADLQKITYYNKGLKGLTVSTQEDIPGEVRNKYYEGQRDREFIRRNGTRDPDDF